MIYRLLPVFDPQFFTEVTEVETWIREKLPRVSSEDYGRDETSAQSLLRKHETFDLEMDSYWTKIKDLRNTCQELVKAKHFDAERIQKRQVRLHDVIYRISKVLIGCCESNANVRDLVTKSKHES